ncbi:MAG: hypothetical protein M1827_006126 [Pycnora praestabilis]|nr:MAG: hypothetical protein M1827_006126 [Pycnora praestabilis]
MIKIRFLEILFTDEIEKQEALTTTLIANTAEEARNVTLQTRFLKKEKTDARKKAITELETLSQEKRTLREYFDAARDIKRFLPSDFKEEVVERLIQGLKNKNLHQILRGINGKDKIKLERAIEQIKGATGEEELGRKETIEEDRQDYSATEKNKSLI